MARTSPTLQQFPKKWALAIVVALIFYALLQPVFNSRLGWQLPSLAGLINGEEPNSKPTVVEPEALPTRTELPLPESQLTVPVQQTPKADLTSAQSTKTDTVRANSPLEKPLDEPRDAEPTPEAPARTNSTDRSTQQLKYGLLKSVGNEVYVSPAGLRYTRGSEEGHRLKHIERHLKDIPDRPGKHGVFDGDMPQVLRWIDDAYTRGQQGAKGVRKQQQENRTVYEVPFAKPIGFIGGKDGRKARNPEAKKLRLVVEGDRVITAFPF